MLNTYEKAKRLDKVAMLGNLLLVGLVLFQVFSSITFRAIPFLVLLIVFGIFAYIINAVSMSIYNKAMVELEEKLAMQEDSHKLTQNKNKEVIKNDR